MKTDIYSFLYKQKFDKKLNNLLYYDEANNRFSNIKINYCNKRVNNKLTHLNTDLNKNKQNTVIARHDFEKSSLCMKNSFNTLKSSFNNKTNSEENPNIFFQLKEVKELKENIPLNGFSKCLLSTKSKKVNTSLNKYINKRYLYHNNSCIKKNNLKCLKDYNEQIIEKPNLVREIRLGPKNRGIFKNLSTSNSKFMHNEINKKIKSFGLFPNEVNKNSILKIMNNREKKNNIITKKYYLQKNNTSNNYLFYKNNYNLKPTKNTYDFNEENIFDYNDEKQVELTKEEKILYGNRIMEGYSKIKLLGKGGYGIVWLCYKNNNQYDLKEYAVKQTSKKKNQESSHNLNNILSNARKEIAVLNILNNKNSQNNHGLDNSDDTGNTLCELIPKIYDSYEDNNDIWFSFEKGGISLSNLCFKIKGEFEKGERIYLIQKGMFLMSLFSNINQFKYLLKQIILGINYINSKGIVHSDIKPENILIDYIQKEDIFKINSIKIIDYGSSFLYNEISSSTTSNTPEYLCPEITTGNKKFIKDLSNNDKYINAIDIWSVGITFLELCLCCPIWMNFKTKISINGKILYTHGIFGCRMRDANKIYQKQIEVSKNLNKILKYSLLYMFEKEDRNNFVDLLGRMLTIDYTKRITTEEILRHPFLNEIFLYN